MPAKRGKGTREGGKGRRRLFFDQETGESDRNQGTSEPTRYCTRTIIEKERGSFGDFAVSTGPAGGILVEPDHNRGDVQALDWMKSFPRLRSLLGLSQTGVESWGGGKPNAPWQPRRALGLG